MHFLQCFDLLGGQQGGIRPVKSTTSIILSSNKIQNGDILALANLGPPGKWPLNQREIYQPHKNYTCIFSLFWFLDVLVKNVSTYLIWFQNKNAWKYAVFGTDKTLPSLLSPQGW